VAEIVSNEVSFRTPVCSRKASSLFGLAALNAFALDPAEEARECGAVAGGGGAVAGDLDRVLDCLGEDDGVAEGEDLGTAGLERLRDRGDGALGIGGDALAGVGGEGGSEGGAVVQADRVAEMLADGVVELVGSDEQVGGAVRAYDRIGECDGGVVDVAAADVERPGDRIERGEDDRVGVVLGQPVGDFRALLG
jgi:hypothetical protein